jgi:hypothetical protein
MNTKGMVWLGIWTLLLSYLVIGSVFAFISFSFIESLKGDLGRHRFCLKMTSDQNIDDTDGGDGTALGTGWIEINTKTKKISYELLFDVSSDTPTSLSIKGPVTGDSVTSGSAFFPSDGTSIADLEADNDGAYRGKAPITTAQSKAILDNPAWYYVLLKTESYPSGSIATRLLSECPPRI